MNGRTTSRWLVGVAIAALAPGCAGFPSSRREPTDWQSLGKSQPPINDTYSGGSTGTGNGYAHNGASPGNGSGTVVQAGGVSNPANPALGYLPQVPPVPGQEQPGGGGTLPTPRPLPTDPLAPQGPPGTPGTGGTPPTPGAPGTPTALPPGAKPNDPNVLRAPSALGARLGLGPNEVPTDRVVDLTQQLAVALAQNRDLQARIRELEAQGLAREQALAEAVREVETASAEVAKTRAAFLAMRAEIAALQKTVALMEKDEIETLKLVIESLKKLLAAQRGGSP